MNQAPTPNNFQEEARHAREATKRLKRRMLIVIACMVAFVAIAIPLINVLEQVTNEKENPPAQTVRPGSVIFYTPDYDANILKDPEYLELDRDFRLKDGNITTTLDPKRIHSYSPGIGVIYELVNAVINGDADAYNALFSDAYFDENDPEPPFTMQRVYDIVIVKIREQTVVSETAGKYSEYIYELEYKINRNDGTYRTDIGHDASRSQYFCITDKEGEVKIDRLMYMLNE